MANKPTDLPEWASSPSPGDVVEPIAAEKASGFLAFIKPAHQTFNWLLNNLYSWMQYLNDGVLEPIIRVKSKVSGDDATAIFRIQNFAGDDKIGLRPGQASSDYGGGKLEVYRADDSVGWAYFYTDIQHTGATATDHTWLLVDNSSHADARCTISARGGVAAPNASPTSGLRFSYIEHGTAPIETRIECSPWMGGWTLTYVDRISMYRPYMVADNADDGDAEPMAYAQLPPNTAQTTTRFRYPLTDLNMQNVTDGLDGTSGKRVWQITGFYAELNRITTAGAAGDVTVTLFKAQKSAIGAPTVTAIHTLSTATTDAWVQVSYGGANIDVDPRQSYFLEIEFVSTANGASSLAPGESAKIRNVYIELDKYGVE